MGRRSRKPDKNESNSAANGGQEGNEPQPRGVDIAPLVNEINSFSDAYKTAHTNDDEHAHKQLFWNRVTAISTTAAFVAAAIYAAIANKQLNSMSDTLKEVREANKIARNAFDVANRPYVGLDGIDLSQVTDPANNIRPAARVDVHVKNFGTTPAVDWRPHWKVFIDDKPQPGMTLKGVTIPKFSPGATIYPAETRHLILLVTDADYENVFVKHTSILALDIGMEYEGLGAHYAECTRHSYYFVDNSFQSLGPICQK